MEGMLERCERLSYAGRMKYMVEVGRQAKSDPAVRRALAELQKSEFSYPLQRPRKFPRKQRSFTDFCSPGSLYEQLLSLQACFGSQEPTLPVQALLSPSAHIRRRAFAIAPVWGSDDELLEVLPKLSLQMQRRLVKRAKTRGRQPILHSFLESVPEAERSKKPGSFRHLLPLASTSVVKSWLDLLGPDFIDDLDDTEWKNLAQHHASITMDIFYNSVVRTVPESDSYIPSWIQKIDKIVPWLLRARQTRHTVLELVDLILRKCQKWASTHPSHARYSFTHYWRLAGLYPKELPRMFVKYGHVPDIRGGDVLRAQRACRLMDEVDLLSLTRKASEQSNRKGLFASPFLIQIWAGLTDAQREGLFLQIQKTKGCGEPLKDTITHLPRALRIAEARRRVEGFPGELSDERYRWIPMLPWSEAFALQKPLLRSSDVHTRARALGTQISTASSDNSDDTSTSYQAALDLILERSNDQDLVRLSMITALWCLPIRHWREHHFDGLESVIRKALDATDLSPTSAHRYADLVGKLLGIFPEWSWRQITVIHREREQRKDEIKFSLKTKADREQLATKLAAITAPTVEEWSLKEQYSDIHWLAKVFLSNQLEIYPDLRVALCEAFESTGDLTIYLMNDTQNHGALTTLQSLPEIKERMEQALSTTVDQQRASRFVKILTDQEPGSASARILKLLSEDRTWIRYRLVQRYLLSYHQELLTPYLTPSALEGRFNPSGELLRVVPSARDVHKLSKKQQEIVACLQVENVRNEDLRAGVHKKALNLLSLLHFTDPDKLIGFVEDDRPLIQQLAIRNLARLDSGGGLPKLIECLADDRARYAIYALTPLLHRLPPAEALSLLKGTSMRKVTVAKQIIRLVSELDSEESYQYLLDVAHGELHVDTRRALLTCMASNFLGKEQTWQQVLIPAARGDKDIATEVVHTLNGVGHRSDLIQQLARDLVVALLQHPAISIRQSVLANIGRDHAVRDPGEELLPPIKVFLSSEDVRESQAAAETIFKRYHAHLEIITSYFGRLGDYRDLDNMLSRYEITTRGRRSEMKLATLAVISVLAQDRLNFTRRLRLIILAMPFEDTRVRLVAMIPALHADALVEAEKLMFDLYRRHNHLDSLEQELRSGKHEASRRLGLAVLLAMSSNGPGDSPRSGQVNNKTWNAHRRSVLRIYQSDRSLLVAEAASKVYPPDEDIAGQL